MIQRPVLGAACIVALAPFAAAQSFQYSDFNSTAGLQLVERAAGSGAILRVHDQAAPQGAGNRGAAWFGSPVSVANGFDTTFVFNINQGGSASGGGDGMAFVIQNDLVAGDTGGVGLSGIGRHASAIGYGIFPTSNPGESIDNSLAIEIDTFLNSNQPAAAPIMDPDGNHISIHTGGSGENDQREDWSIGRAPNSALGGVNMSDGQDHTVRVHYVPGTLDVYLDGVMVLSTSYSFSTGGTHIDTGNAVGGLNLIGGTSAYVGFTGSSGSSVENHDVISWTFDSAGPGGNYCTANVNSSGAAASMSAMSSLSIATNDTVLTSTGMPNLAFGFFITSQTQGFVMNPAGSAGNLCLAGGIGRYVGPGQIQNSGTIGSISLSIDLNQIPTPTGLVQASAGQTWNFQAWFRDASMGVPTSNFSDGLSLTFTN
ncbi:Legume lectin domain protein [Planctomycetes bacterium Poly30]|uniref:Legume lectin domain protein n=1 Tax=Saltatorellus ferox TaxID=2528018 RepID=A0A518ER01_9BACT|nr:Legume lectin domain protein [Planctomycetes bacterium Poly30]